MTKFKRWRKENRITQRQLADEMGCSVTTIKKWEGENVSIGKRFIQAWDENRGIDPIEEFGFTVHNPADNLKHWEI